MQKNTKDSFEISIPELFDTLDATTSSIEAMSVMVGFAIESGMDLKYISHGIESLIRQQCDDLRNIEANLRNGFQRLKESKFVTLKPDMIARLAGITPELAERLVKIVTTVDYQPETNCDEMLNA
ncbi:MAG: hypothetical protein KF874_07045 [Rhizobiaceae bacterium]|nr:hypothetical protein [Rhizobiaceae bacterium]